MENRKRIGVRLRQMRDEAGYSLRALRDISGLSVPTLVAIEAGEPSVKVSSLAAYAELFGLAVREELEERCS